MGQTQPLMNEEFLIRQAVGGGGSVSTAARRGGPMDHSSGYNSNQQQFVLEDAEKRQSIKHALQTSQEITYKAKIAKFASVAPKLEMTVTIIHLINPVGCELCDPRKGAQDSNRPVGSRSSLPVDERRRPGRRVRLLREKEEHQEARERPFSGGDHHHSKLCCLKYPECVEADSERLRDPFQEPSDCRTAKGQTLPDQV